MSPTDDDLLASLDLASIQDPHMRQILSILLNIIERQRCEVRLLKEENQRLRDEPARRVRKSAVGAGVRGII